MTEEQIKSLQSTGGDALAETEKNILGNHMNRLWEIVKASRSREAAGKGGRIDFVLDNAGFELYCDCVYGESDQIDVFKVCLTWAKPTSSSRRASQPK